MDFTYSIWILLLPLISFLVIGLPEFVNKKYSWSHKTAGLIGTCSLGLVAALSYYTAFQYLQPTVLPTAHSQPSFPTT